MIELGLESIFSKTNLFGIKKNFLSNKWLIGIYILFILGFSIYQFGIAHKTANFNITIFTIVILFFAGVFCILYTSKNRNKLHRVALVIILIFGLISLFYAPILVHCDEDEHLVRSELTSHGELIPIRELQPSGKMGYSSIQVTKDLDDKSRFKTIFNSPLANSKINTNYTIQGSTFAQNPFYAYIPQGIGIAIAKALDLNAIWILWLGGLCNLLMYAGVCCIAVKKAPIFKIPLMAVACLPFSIQQATSLSSDACVIAFSILTVAYFLYLYKSPDKSITWKNLAKFFIICLIVVLIKVPYLIFSLLILLIPRRKFKNKQTYLIAWGGIMGLIIITVLWDLLYAVPQLNNSFRGTRAKIMHVDAGDQMKFLISNPDKALGIFNYASTDWWYCINDMFRFADWQGTRAYSSKFMTIIFMGFFGILSLLYPLKDKIATKRKVAMIFIVLLAYYGLHLIQYLTWTPFSSPKIAGLQGRYFIPLLLLIPFILGINYDGSRIREKIIQKTDCVNINNFDSWSVVFIISLLACLSLLTVAIYY